MTDLIEELGLIATQAERSSAFTDEAQWMRTDGVADALYRAIDRIEQLEAAYSQQQQVWSDAIARADRYEAALNKCVDIVETYRIPVGNSAAGEMACEWTYDALKQIRDDMKDVISAALARSKKDE